MTGPVLVTGGAGFIGSHLCTALAARGDDYRILDNFDDFYDPALKRANIELLEASGPVDLVEGDLRDRDTVRAAVHGARAVIHLAALAGVRPSIERPLDYEEVNVKGTMHVLDAIREGGAVPFLFGSSSSVYGGSKDVPFSEDKELGRPVSPYAATKRMGELICWTYHHLYEIPTTCLRFFTVYGPRQRPEMAIHKFARLMLDGQPVPMFGDGTSQRDYTWVGDIVDGVMAALDRCEGYDILNLGGGQTISLADMIDALGEALGVEPVVDQLPWQPGDVPITYADVTRSRAALDWEPRTPIHEGIVQFAEWIRGQDR